MSTNTRETGLFNRIVDSLAILDYQSFVVWRALKIALVILIPVQPVAIGYWRGRLSWVTVCAKGERLWRLVSKDWGGLRSEVLPDSWLGSLESKVVLLSLGWSCGLDFFGRHAKGLSLGMYLAVMLFVWPQVAYLSVARLLGLIASSIC